MIERSCKMARMFAERASDLPHAHILNDVSLNQVLLRFAPPNVTDLDHFHEAVAQAVQRQGRCWLGTTLWSGETVLRLSFSNWQTGPNAVQEAVDGLAEAVAHLTKTN
jgi:glutamate/tyrosine decarboxylase-like PLP-dependent enzyme